MQMRTKWHVTNKYGKIQITPINQNLTNMAKIGISLESVGNRDLLHITDA